MCCGICPEEGVGRWWPSCGGRARKLAGGSWQKQPRLGEALNPGPAGAEDKPVGQWIGTANTTSLLEQWADVADLGAKAWLFQEARCKSSEGDELLRLSGWAAVWSHPGEDGNALAAIAVQRGHLGKVALPFLSAKWSQRVVAGLWAPDGGRPIMLVSIYGVSSPTAADREQLNAIVLEIMDLAESKGAVGCCMGGDFNCVVAELPAAGWMQACGWSDISSEPTCVTARSLSPSRIDSMFLNRFLTPLVADVQVRWDTAVPVHAVQLVQVMVDNNRSHRAWKAGHKYDECQMNTEQMEDLGQKLVASARHEWHEAKAAGMDSM